MAESCASCSYSNVTTADDQDGPVPVFECRRYPPSFVPDGRGGMAHVAVRSDDWCGEYLVIRGRRRDRGGRRG